MVTTTRHFFKLELIEHITRVPWCSASVQQCPGEIRSIEHAQDSLVQACAVDLIGVAVIGNKKAVFVTLVDRISRFEAY